MKNKQNQKNRLKRGRQNSTIFNESVGFKQKINFFEITSS